MPDKIKISGVGGLRTWIGFICVRRSMEFAMSTPVKFAFALFVAFASAASFAQHGRLAATRNVSITTSDSGGVGKCFQGSPATATERDRDEFVHPGGVCWAPQDDTEGPGV
jgi:hypothetical protein